LAEHRGYGLPDWGATRASFDEAGWDTFALAAGNLYNWLFMMVAKHYLISMRDPQAAEFERKLDRFYNLTFSEGDRSEPAYRGVVVATRMPHPAAFAALGQAYPPVPADARANTQRLELANLLLRLLDLRVANHEDRALREQLIMREVQATALEGKTGMLERDLAEARGHITNLQAGIESLRAPAEAYIAEQQARVTLRDEMDRLRDERDSLRAARDMAVSERERVSAEYQRASAELDRKNAHILYLERLLGGIQAGRVFRLTRTAARLLGRK
jgi:hypothetical protein